jgi:amidase
MRRAVEVLLVREAEPALGPDVAARVKRAAGFGPADVADAEPVAAGVADALRRLRADEALLIPAAGAVAPTRDADPQARERARVAAGRLSCIASLAGTPAVALPLATVGGLPVGISLVGRPGSDHALLAAAARSAALDPVRE